MKAIHIILFVATLLTIFVIVGPKPKAGDYTGILPVIADTGMALQQFVATHEAQQKLKPDNEARIIWHNDSLKNKTEYAIVYLHGFTASQEEGDPVHTNLAKAIGANLYLARLSEHGKDTSAPLYHMTASSLWSSAKEAYAIGRQLGKKVILVGTSTGGTLALMLAAEQYPGIAGLILLSPNIEINDPNAWLLNNPWGLQVAQLVVGGDSRKAGDNRDIYRKYWYPEYRLEGVVELQQMLEDKMNRETFSQVNQPLLMMYYFKDEQHQDPVVRVPAMLAMFNTVSTLDEAKKAIPVPASGDHVIGSYIKSGDVQTVEAEALKFTREVIMKN